MESNRIKKYIPYEFGFDILNGTIVAHVRYPNGWKVVESDDGVLKTSLDTPSGRQYYWADDNMDLDLILDAIDNTIELNKDMEARYELLRTKIEELKNLFVERDLSDLQLLEFTFKKKPQPKKKTVKKPSAPNVEEQIKDDSVTEIKKEDCNTESNNPKTELMEGEILEVPVEVNCSDIDRKIEAAMKKKKNIR